MIILNVKKNLPDRGSNFLKNISTFQKNCGINPTHRLIGRIIKPFLFAVVDLVQGEALDGVSFEGVAPVGDVTLDY